MAYSLTYIYHDCFVISTDDAVMIFDYWKDPLAGPDGKDFPPLLDEIDPGKSIYVIISHHHKDHFSRRVFLWQKRFPDIQYVISPDVFKAVKYLFKPDGTYQGFKPNPESVHVLKEGEVYSDGTVRIKAFGSTDIGNSYLVENSGYRFFHAGDLNAWLWLDESTPEEVDEARRGFTEIMEKVRTDCPALDLVMFPVDSRMGRDYWWGARFFVDNILCNLFVPMHFELVLDEADKEQRRLDAGAFDLYARRDYGSYLQLASTRSRYFTS